MNWTVSLGIGKQNRGLHRRRQKKNIQILIVNMDDVMNFPIFFVFRESTGGKSEKNQEQKLEPPLFSSGTSRAQLQCGLTAPALQAEACD